MKEVETIANSAIGSANRQSLSRWMVGNKASLFLVTSGASDKKKL
jgi:hypothetical protein